jgi:hypothetical protein
MVNFANFAFCCVFFANGGFQRSANNRDVSEAPIKKKENTEGKRDLRLCPLPWMTPFGKLCELWVSTK